MSRRVSLPGADELFGRKPLADPALVSVVHSATTAGDATGSDSDDGLPGKPSGRVRHDEKITIYVTPDELVGLEMTRLELRRAHGLAVDRGRLVREAIHLTLEDLASRGDDSDLVRRLRAG